MTEAMSSSAQSDLEDFIRSIPKTETHLHIEGALPYGLLRELDSDRFPKEPFFRDAGYRYPNFVEFETLLIDHAMAWYTGPERYHQACQRIFSDLVERNVKYLETSFHLPIIEFTNSDGHELIHAIKSAAPEGLIVKVIGGLTRDSCTEKMRPIIEELHQWDDLDGIDLHGQEWLELEDWSEPLWRRCSEAGKILKAHAGEFGGPEKVREALDVLGVDRIQHGVRSVEDPALVERLRDEKITLDVCPISNEKLRVVSSMEEHPIKKLIESGVACTVSTDDPLCFANTLDDEYLALSQRVGLSHRQLAEIAGNGFEVARMESSLKRECMRQINEIVGD